MKTEASKQRVATVAVVSMGLDSSRVIEQILTKSTRYRCALIDHDKIKRQAAKAAPEIVILDVAQITDSEVDALNEIRAEFGETPLVVVSEALDDDEVRRLFRFKVHDWLRKPLDEQKLLASLQGAVRTGKTTTNRVHAVVSCVGGAGASTVAVSMADIMARKRASDGASVALFDLDFSTGNCSYLLNMINAYNLESVAATPSRIDAEFINLIQQRHENGFYVYSFKRPDIVTELNGYELVLRMLDAVSMQHDVTILDIPYYELDWKNEVLSAVNTCTLVTEMNLPAIKHTLDLLHRVQQMRGADFPVQVVFNKHERHLFGQRIKPSKLKELFGTTTIDYLPSDDDVIEEAMDRGLPPSEVRSGARFLKALSKYIDRYLQGERVVA
jgi:pilus assembly protein CpaE